MKNLMLVVVLSAFLVISGLYLTGFLDSDNDEVTNPEKVDKLSVEVDNLNPENPRGFTVTTSGPVDRIWVEGRGPNLDYNQELESENGTEWRIPRGTGPHPRDARYFLHYEKDGEEHRTEHLIEVG